MSTLVAIAYPDADTAERVRGELIQATKEHLLTLEDAVVVVHQPDGKIKLHQAASMAGVGAAGGAMWGGLIGLLFLAPLFGMAIGAATGAVGREGVRRRRQRRLLEGTGGEAAARRRGADRARAGRSARQAAGAGRPVRRRSDPDLAQQRGRGAAAHGARRARRGRLVMARLLTDEQTVELLELAKHSDSVELKLTIAESEQRSALLALKIDPLDAQIRQVFFLDTPDLQLNQAGVVVRARRVQNKGDDSVVKLRPIDPQTLPKEFRTSSSFGVEVDAMPGGFVCSGTMKRVLPRPEVKDAMGGDRPVRKLFSKEQRAFYETYAPEGVGIDDLTILGPVFVLKLKQTPPELGRRLVTELWLYPDDSRILELSTKCAPNEAFQVAAEMRAFLAERGIDTTAEQETKTKRALEFFSRRG